MDYINKRFTIHVNDNEMPIDIFKLYNEYLDISAEEKRSIAEVAKSAFSWNSIMSKLLKEMEKND